MVCDPKYHNRRSIRLNGYDYARAGAYFVTICTHRRECLFGDVVNGEMRLNNARRAARQCWNGIPDYFPNVRLDEWVIMPNHVHGIIFIIVGANNHSPLPTNATSRPRGTSKTIGSIVRGFKIGVSKWMRKHTSVHNVWQRGYYEHIIRTDESLNRIREYIINNPLQWALDRENPNVGAKNFSPLPKDEPWRV